MFSILRNYFNYLVYKIIITHIFHLSIKISQEKVGLGNRKIVAIPLTMRSALARLEGLLRAKEL